jgi:hypothetical protein
MTVQQSAHLIRINGVCFMIVICYSLVKYTIGINEEIIGL